MATRKRGEDEGLVRVGNLLPAVLPAGLFDEVIRPEDVGYTHPVFLQCFMPTRESAKNRLRWQANCGRASLVIRAGELANPEKENEYVQCSVPSGPKARFVVAYVNDYIQTKKTPVVNMGENLRAAMDRLHIPIGGANGAELTKQVKNFAAAEIGIGRWNEEGKVTHDRSLVAAHMSFWLEKDRKQRTIWEPEMKVSTEYFDAVRDGDRLAPFYWPALLALQHDTRAMDIHCFLTYRLRNGLNRPVALPVPVLHALFGKDIASPRKFWSSFKKSLLAAHKWYPKARIEVKNDCIVLKDSPALIPYRKMARITG